MAKARDARGFVGRCWEAVRAAAWRAPARAPTASTDPASGGTSPCHRRAAARRAPPKTRHMHPQTTPQALRRRKAGCSARHPRPRPAAAPLPPSARRPRPPARRRAAQRRPRQAGEKHEARQRSEKKWRRPPRRRPPCARRARWEARPRVRARDSGPRRRRRRAQNMYRAPPQHPKPHSDPFIFGEKLMRSAALTTAARAPP
jgi:hypothetical protein